MPVTRTGVAEAAAVIAEALPLPAPTRIALMSPERRFLTLLSAVAMRIPGPTASTKGGKAAAEFHPSRKAVAKALAAEEPGEESSVPRPGVAPPWGSESTI
jgi:hypothetical protein